MLSKVELNEKRRRAAGLPNDTHDRLLVIAAKLFRSRGYDATSMRELANKLGITKGSVYHHIPTKEDLLYQLIDASTTALKDAMLAAVTKEVVPKERLAAFIRAHVTVTLRNPDPYAVALFEVTALTKQRRNEIQGRWHDYESSLEQLIIECQRASVLRRELEPRHATRCLLGMMNWAIFWYPDAATAGALALADRIEDLFFRGSEMRKP
jgi:TetR/AcrR family transcriptional regulator, cholesterol catabolism regulator